MISFAEVPIGSGGLPTCAQYCSAPSGLAPDPRPSDDITRDLQAICESWGLGQSGPGPNCSFIGFEPFAHRQLPALIGAAASLGYERIRLRTDAGALTRPGNAEGILGAGVHHLEVVVLAADDAHDRLTARPGLFNAAEEGCAAFFSAAGAEGVSVVVSAYVPVCRHSLVGLPLAAAAVARLGAASMLIDVSSLPDTAENRLHLIEALDTATINRVAATVTGWDGPLPLPWGWGVWQPVPAPGLSASTAAAAPGSGAKPLQGLP
ncbi:MAG: hypothetical protein FWE94_05380 [Coriobacteriia bacterium]|nr:hypothetical protein [Coriobacteriia bacterium]